MPNLDLKMVIATLDEAAPFRSNFIVMVLDGEDFIHAVGFEETPNTAEMAPSPPLTKWKG